MIRINKLIVTVKKCLHFNDNECRHNNTYCSFYKYNDKCCIFFDEDLEYKNENSLDGNGILKIPVRCKHCTELFGEEESNVLSDLIHE